jgi:hypothetical protein
VHRVGYRVIPEAGGHPEKEPAPVAAKPATRRVVCSRRKVQDGKVNYQIYNSYFESNRSGLKGSSSYLVLTNQAAFDTIFSAAAIMGPNRFLPENYFRSHMVAAVIKRGRAPWTYNITHVTTIKNTLYIHYNASAKSAGGATFASPAIMGIDKRNYASVVFIENGKEVGAVPLRKSRGVPSSQRLSDRGVAVRKVRVYLVAVGDNGKAGKKIGCDDSLVAINRSIPPTHGPLKAALQQLLSIPSEYGEVPKLNNFWKGRNLRLKSVSIWRRTAIIRIAGEIFVAGICDEPRIVEQIEATARQFPSVQRVRVFVGNRTLAEAIS